VDPPSYGHGPAGGDWRIERDLEPLLDELATATGDDVGFVLLTAHSPSLDPERLGGLLGDAFSVDPEVDVLELRAESGARLQLGSMARWVRP
jgi:23S rRNA G2069 N7-methylase RlmK/C1962 C5-methylase RlmI